ncbi:MAG: hypothetical protein ACD_75C00577G0001 [uncultured bacterium]|nr:MAG: hypothetical protein ACD_75C00577G0001 [uncultured bacterium]
MFDDAYIAEPAEFSTNIVRQIGSVDYPYIRNAENDKNIDDFGKVGGCLAESDVHDFLQDVPFFIGYLGDLVHNVYPSFSCAFARAS